MPNRFGKSVRKLRGIFFYSHCTYCRETLILWQCCNTSMNWALTLNSGGICPLSWAVCCRCWIPINRCSTARGIIPTSSSPSPQTSKAVPIVYVFPEPVCDTNNTVFSFHLHELLIWCIWTQHHTQTALQCHFPFFALILRIFLDIIPPSQPWSSSLSTSFSPYH